ncbi:DUF86 domain-containing protein [Planococcus shenhongbingii]|uniref:DUF86 domain-containing protein n=1 Tax=Planococcus shenhongbingii TaxID=3058398 RepID=A0ABT8NH58_9BACL|nr:MULTISPECIES: DUF86 domain-containing protein [unclassified Planococcus (in: firmicutes)]MDN7247228.1 DUF86 domain-containing protein [Planococcus sp. N017]WKA59748.1 DUF86 domain-containing protein [Planococcus sp. N016]
MYFIDRNKITETVAYMSSLVELYEEKKEWSTLVDQLALERLANNIIESIIDVGNSMIDGFIMRDPGSYEDIIDILVDEKVITAEMDEPLKQVVELRKMLVREFMKVDHQELVAVIGSRLESLKDFGPKVEYYLEHELGPVSAFLPESKNERL